MENRWKCCGKLLIWQAQPFVWRFLHVLPRSYAPVRRHLTVAMHLLGQGFGGVVVVAVLVRPLGVLQVLDGDLVEPARCLCSSHRSCCRSGCRGCRRPCRRTPRGAAVGQVLHVVEVAPGRDVFSRFRASPSCPSVRGSYPPSGGHSSRRSWPWTCPRSWRLGASPCPPRSVP